jgi:uncharacterized membrane protein
MIEKTYNQIAGQSVERIAALSDGLFAIGMTIIVLELHVPLPADIHTELDLWNGLVGVSPKILMYLMSFLTLGIFWVGQQTQLNLLARTDRNLAWLHLAFLFLVSMIAFSTSLLGQFMTFRLALIFYWLNILLLGVTLWLCWRYATHAGLVKADAPPNILKAVERRITISQTLYFIAMLFCFVSIPLSIGLIVLLQLNYAIAPKIGLLSKI